VDITIIVPCRNEVARLNLFFSKLLNNIPKKLLCEIIVVDGKSTDGSCEILKKIEGRATFLL
jgi:glycosyltransferase involved in cell wall biosynthesis